jgi:uncharacterized protein YdaU (DUF1376 family)
MSEPYLPLYVGDYLKDTGSLTIEQHGAYFMLLMRMWSAGGSLPDDDGKLSRLVGVTVKKFKAIWPDLSELFQHADGRITHKRVTLELQKAEALREKRAAAGAKGGAAKTLKTNTPNEAIAKAEPKQIISGQVERDTSQAQHPLAGLGKPDLNLIEIQLREASGQQTDPTPSLFVLSAPIGWLQSGHDWQLDVLPTVRGIAARMTRKPKSWDYYTEPIREASAKRRGMSLAPPVASVAAGKPDIFNDMAKEARNGRQGASGRSVGTTIDAVSSIPLIGRQVEPDDGEGVFARH